MSKVSSFDIFDWLYEADDLKSAYHELTRYITALTFRLILSLSVDDIEVIKQDFKI